MARQPGDERRWRVLLFTVYSLGIAWLSLSDPDSVPGLDIAHLDKIAHFGVYGIYVVIGTWALRGDAEGGPGVGRRAISASFWCCAYGAVMEVLQLVLAGNRNFSVGDIAANVAGTILFAVVYVVLVSRRIIRE